jgi:hypothetical protein
MSQLRHRGRRNRKRLVQSENDLRQIGCGIIRASQDTSRSQFLHDVRMERQQFAGRELFKIGHWTPDDPVNHQFGVYQVTARKTKSQDMLQTGQRHWR